LSYDSDLDPNFNISDAGLKEISDLLTAFTTTLIILQIDSEGNPFPKQVGTGTFVKIGKTYGILTAEHVTSEIKWYMPCPLGLTLVPEVHRFDIKPGYFDIIDIGIPPIEGEGPDISIILLGDPDVGAIKARKSFLELDRDRRMMLDQPPLLNDGPWFLCGVPCKRTTQEDPEGGFKDVTGFHGMCGITNPLDEYSKDGFDYIEVDADYKAGVNIPPTFKGFSGGGLWQIIPSESKLNHFILGELLLSGITFAQSAVFHEHRTITCHSRLSIYRKVLEVLVN
jgi:hypothetical protein